jgi:uncharacterized protein
MSVAMLIGIAALSLVAASVAGLLGAGGDILYVPLLLYVLPAFGGTALDVHTVGALSLVQSLASTGSGGVVHYIDDRIHHPSFRAAVIPLAAGALAGGVLSRLVAGSILVALVAMVASVVAVLLVVPVRLASPRSSEHRDPIAFGLLAATALVCGLVGVGGGFLIVTILLYRNRLSMQLAKGTALALTVCTAAPALLGKLLTGQLTDWAPVPVIVVAAVLGGILGARLSTALSPKALRVSLAALVVVLAARLWIGAIG